MRATYIVMYSTLLLNKAHSHVEPVEEDTGNPERNLGQIEQDPDLDYEVNSLGPSQSFLGRG